MIVTKLSDIKSQPLFYQLKNFITNSTCYLKLEGYNIAGSLKLKSAVRMLESLEPVLKVIKGRLASLA